MDHDREQLSPFLRGPEQAEAASPAWYHLLDQLTLESPFERPDFERPPVETAPARTDESENEAEDVERYELEYRRRESTAEEAESYDEAESEEFEVGYEGERDDLAGERGAIDAEQLETESGEDELDEVDAEFPNDREVEEMEADADGELTDELDELEVETDDAEVDAETERALVAEVDEGERYAAPRARRVRRPRDAADEPELEQEDGVTTPAIDAALAKKDEKQALKLAIEQDWRNPNKLTNLVFFNRHPELAGRKLKDDDPADRRLGREWAKIRDTVVWKAIQTSAKNGDLVVSGALAAAQHRKFWGKSGESFRQLVEWAAKETGLDPALLAASLLAETDRGNYLSKGKVSSYRIGTDDFYSRRRALRDKVPAYARVGWDKNQALDVHPNDALKPRDVTTIDFDSGKDALLASAVYLKFGEVHLREKAAELGGDFDALPREVRFALTRIAFAAGPGGGEKRLKLALKGTNILVRKDLPLKPRQTQRNATIRTAQALHLSDWFFRSAAAPAAVPELEFGSDEALALEGEFFEPETPAQRDAAAQRKIKHWTLLPHQITVGGTRVALEPSRLSLPFYASGQPASTDPLPKLLAEIVKERRFKSMSIALVDLTKDPLKPELALHDGTTMRFAMSIPKIAAMYAAFQLRCDLRGLTHSSGATSAEDLFAAARAGWIAVQTPASASKENAYLGMKRKDSLLLVRGRAVAIWPWSKTRERTASVVSGKIKMTNWQTIKTENHAAKWKLPVLETMFDIDATKSPLGVDFSSGFKHDMELMIGASKNSAAAACIRATGYLAIASVMMQSGLVDPVRGGGLWLASDYAGHCLEKKELLGWKICVKDLHHGHSFIPFGGGSQHSTALSLVAFATLLAQGRLVEPKSSTEMLDLMDKSKLPGSETRSPLTETLDRTGIPTKVFSKLGWTGPYSDVVLVERTIGGKTLKYAAAAMSSNIETITALGEKLEAAIRTNNGV